MLAYPLAYIISPAALWGGSGGGGGGWQGKITTTKGRRVFFFFLLEDKWLNFHWQSLAVVFPIWLWLPLSRAGLPQPITPPPHPTTTTWRRGKGASEKLPTETAASALPDREASRKPEFISSSSSFSSKLTASRDSISPQLFTFTCTMLFGYETSAQILQLSPFLVPSIQIDMAWNLSPLCLLC